METLQILGWIYLGMMIGGIGGIVVLSLTSAAKYADMESEIISLNMKNKFLRDELSKSAFKGKPQPRKNRNWKKKPQK
jgi:ABC-type lipoprotein release transport system permease subunit